LQLCGAHARDVERLNVKAPSTTISSQPILTKKIEVGEGHIGPGVLVFAHDVKGDRNVAGDDNKDLKMKHYIHLLRLEESEKQEIIISA
jgi:hypothetical protein